MAVACAANGFPVFGRSARLGVLAAVAAGLLQCGCEKEKVRPPTVAGQFYPGEAAELERLVARFLEETPARPYGRVRAILVPHAGYAYSAPVAAAAFRQVQPGFERVFVIAANHNRVHYRGVSTDFSTHFEIPGARIPVDRLTRRLAKDPFYQEVATANASHVIEVELPFLRAAAGPESRFAFVPLVAGELERADVERFASDLAREDDPDTLYVFSVDLSHYYPYEVAVPKDRSCLRSLRDLDPAGVAQCDVDGPQVLLTLATLARSRGWQAHLVMYKNSGDATGERGRVVGYGAMVFTEGSVPDSSETAALLDIARSAIRAMVQTGRMFDPASRAGRSRLLREPGATFVTIEKEGRLRGCIGSLMPTKPLHLDVRDNAIAAATRDARFPPVSAGELEDLDVSVSLLEIPEPLPLLFGAEAPGLLVPHRDGLILQLGTRHSTFLPTVWDQIPEPEDFLTNLCLKQGSPPACWQDPRARLSTYRAVELR